MNKIKLISLDPTILKWKTLEQKKKEIVKALNQSKNSDFYLDIEYQDLKPEIVDERITHAYMDLISKPFLSKGYDFVAIHFPSKLWKKLGISNTFRGLYQKDLDEVAETYFWADEKTLRKGLNQFVQTFLHELSHAYAHGSKTTDMTHTWHNINPDISGIWSGYDMNLYQPERVKLRGFIKTLNYIRDWWLGYNQSRELKPLVARKAQAIIDEMILLGHPVRIVEGYRSLERQTELYNQGRETPGAIVTNAKAGESFHNYGVAVDIIFRKEGYNAPKALWETLGTIGEKHGFSWGGRWKSFTDLPHFEMTFKYKLKDFQKNGVDYSKYN